MCSTYVQWKMPFPPKLDRVEMINKGKMIMFLEVEQFLSASTDNSRHVNYGMYST